MFGLFDKANVEIQTSPFIIMEDDIDCRIRIIPNSDADLRKIEVELYCQETAISRGTTDSYYRRKVFSDLRAPEKETRITRGNPLEFSLNFKLPPFTTPSIYCRNHFVEWFIRVRLDVPLWPDTRAEKAIFITPCMIIEDTLE